MKYKKQLLAYSLVFPLLGAGLLSANSALAYGGMGMFGTEQGSTLSPSEFASRHATMFENEAKLLGVSVDEVKNAWAIGKSMKELAEEKGITAEQLKAKIQALQLTQMKSHLTSLVSQGVITEAQANQRLQFATTQGERGGKRGGRGHGGMGMGGMMGGGL